jgi:dihydrolipoamide dehydrogenase
MKGAREMRVEVKIPQQGLTVETVTIIGWRKSKNDPVREGDILLQIESEKSTLEVEAPVSGILCDIMAVADDEVPIGKVVAYIETKG